MKTKTVLAAAALAFFGCTAAAQAADYNWVVKVGIGDVEPKSHNGVLAGANSSVSNDVQPIITGEWMFMPNWGVEVLASTPWKHDIYLNGAKSGSTKQLPPTVSVQYHFNSAGQVSPFVGVGLNWTMFWNERIAIPGAKLSIGDSLGAALHAGIDFRLSDNWLLAVDARWINISSTVKLNGSKIGTVDVDPMVYGLTVGYRF
ncbi:MAG: outer membrane beta-barrel protein [Rhodanobacter sp.]|jgi:outer membrane protein|nr:outer membrane beta-barrel protein [Rhodanobacter sp.]